MVRWDGKEDAVEMSRQGGEVWVSVPDCPERYCVSNLGRVARTFTQTPFFLRGTPISKGYLSVGLYPIAGGRADTRLIHRIVAQAFLGDPPSEEHTDVRHLDGDHTNNCLYNLAWGTRSDNMRDVVRHRVSGTPTPAPREQGKRWYDGYTSDPHLVRVGLTFFAEGKLTIVDLARLWDTSDDVAANIVRGRRQALPDVEVVVPPAKRRRTKEMQANIEALLMSGLTTAQVNEHLGETLTAQEAHYYRSRARERAKRS